MINMKINTFFKTLFKNGKVNIEESDKTLLKILVNETHVADLYHDGDDFCLVYKKAFSDIGLPAFNPEDLDSASKQPEINHCYKNKNLWFVFAERLHGLGRRDLQSEIKKLGLNNDSDPLLLLGSLGKISIAKPWRLELVKKSS